MTLVPFLGRRLFFRPLEGFALKLPQGAQPLDPIPQKHIHVFANGGAGESFPCQGVGQRPTVLDFLRRNTKWQKKKNL